ncbi:hypothetical protein LC724_29935 [Blautia sp. RD014234]|nr:hypothetical protein [Blautia parvula]
MKTKEVESEEKIFHERYFSHCSEHPGTDCIDFYYHPFRKKQQEEREKLAAAMQQEESGEDDGSLYAGSSKALMINEVNQSGWVELYNCEKEDLDISGIAVLVNGEKKRSLPNIHDWMQESF